MTTGALWRTFDQQTLDAQYSAAGTVPSVEPYFERYAVESARVRAAFDCRPNLAYGDQERQRLDLFPARRAGAPVLVYLHGGYWRRMSKDEFSFFAQPFVEAGYAVVVPSYTLAPVSTLDQIVREMRDVVLWVQRNGAAGNYDPRRMVLAGHSAGAQLAGMLAATDWLEHQLAGNPVVAMCGISGLYDLEPVQRSNVNDWLQLDEEGARRNSPMHRMPRASMPLVAVVGGRETNEFARQTVDFAAAWGALGYPAESHILPGFNHFDIVLDVLEPQSTLREKLLSLLRGAEG